MMTRPNRIRQLGVKIHPEAVADAWYAADCPENFVPDLPRLTLLRWRISRKLRGC
jgi:hypothetical protein